MSVKSVPGCLVLIVPRLIGVPAAVTPGFGPHDDAFVEAVPALLEVEELDASLAGALEVLLELLPQPASTTAATSAMITRTRIGARLSSRSERSQVTMLIPPLVRPHEKVRSGRAGRT